MRRTVTFALLMKAQRLPGAFQTVCTAAGCAAAYAVVTCVVAAGCATDVVLGEHVTTDNASFDDSTTSNDSTTTQATQTAAPTTNDDRMSRCYRLPDGGLPPGKDDRRDEEWPRDGGPPNLDDCWRWDDTSKPPPSGDFVGPGSEDPHDNDKDPPGTPPDGDLLPDFDGTGTG